MGFFNALLACLVALWLTGNVQPGSPIHNILDAVGWILIAVLAAGVGGYLYWKGPEILRDFRSGRLRIR